MKRKLKGWLLLLIMLLSQAPAYVDAAVGSLTISGTTMAVGETKDLKVDVSSNIVSADGNITSNDPTCVEVVSVTSVSGSGNYFMNISLTGDPISNAATVKIKGLKDCTTTLKISNSSLNGSDGREERNLTFLSGNIVVGNSGSSEPTPTDPKSSDATLKSLTVNKGTLSPTFSASVTDYTVEVDDDVTEITIGATANDTKATVSGAGTKTLSAGDNKYVITVTAENGSTKKYNITVKKGNSGGGSGEGDPTDPTPTDDEPKKSSNANLKSLDLSGYTLKPGFNKNVTSYAMTVNNSVTALDVTALAEDEKASVYIEGNDNWKVGVNNVKVTVTAEDGSQKVYIVAVTRKDKDGNNPTSNKSSDNNLESLIVKNGELSPSFSKDTVSYTVKLPHEYDALDLEYITSNSKAKVTVTGNKDLKVGETNVVTVTVTAEDGSQKVYTINVTRSDKDSNNKLKELVIPGTTLSPQFDPEVFEYTTEVDPKTKSLDVTAVAKNDKAKVEVIGANDLKDGNNTVLVKVTDEEGFVQYYKIDVYKKADSFSIFGIKMPKWLGYLLLGLLLFTIIFLIILLVKRKRKKDKEVIVKDSQMQIPNIEIKPEFNFGSKNEDNDRVSGGVLSQGSGKIDNDDRDNNSYVNEDEDDYEEYDEEDSEEEIPYDPYDDIVTKDEIIDAIKEKDSKKLKILYEQELLNRRKEKLKKEEESDDDDYEDED